MLKRLFFAMALLILFSTSHAGTTIHVLPGPLDGNRVLTPWGEYVVIQRGSTIWVGTAKEYEAARANSLFEQIGAKAFTPEGDFKEGNFFIDRGALKTNIGNVQIDGISTSILFGVKADKTLHRNPKRADQEYVNLVWLQSQKASIGATMYASDQKTSYSSYTCGIQEMFHYCEFAVPRAVLGQKVSFLFTVTGKPPSVVILDSLAKAEFDTLEKKLKRNPFGVMPASEDDQFTLAQLHAIDPSLPDAIPGVPLEPPRPVGCVKGGDANKLTKAQYMSVKVGETMEQIDCRFGPHEGHIQFSESPEIIWIWSYGKGSKANVVFDGKTKQVIDKYLGVREF